MRALNFVIFFLTVVKNSKLSTNKEAFLLIKHRCTIYTNHAGEILCTEKHKTIKIDLVGEQPATMYMYIQISWKKLTKE